MTAFLTFFPLLLTSCVHSYYSFIYIAYFLFMMMFSLFFETLDYLNSLFGVAHSFALLFNTVFVAVSFYTNEFILFINFSLILVLAILFSTSITLPMSKSMNYMIRNRSEETNMKKYPTIYLAAITVIVGGVVGAMGVKGILFAVLMIFIIIAKDRNVPPEFFHLLEIKGLVMLLVSVLCLLLLGFSLLCFGMEVENWLKKYGVRTRIPLFLITIKSWFARILMLFNFILILVLIVRVCMILFFGHKPFYFREDFKFPQRTKP
jgi:hypothetical protein